MKQFVHRRSDQTFPTMVKLIEDSRVSFIQRNVSIKLYRRFWRTLEAYANGDSYTEVLKLYFSSLCKSDGEQHRKITNSNLDDDDGENEDE